MKDDFDLSMVSDKIVYNTNNRKRYKRNIYSVSTKNKLNNCSLYKLLWLKLNSLESLVTGFLSILTLSPSKVPYYTLYFA